MRFLHTSDWHVGKSIGGRSRIDEYDAALTEVVGIAIQERVDAVLVSGDLYEQRAPAAEADGLVFETLIRLHEAGIRTVVIPGNHDAAGRFAAFAPLLARIGVSVVSHVRPPDEGGCVEVPSRDGGEAAVIACVPFVPERRFGDAAALFEASESWYLSYAAGMAELLKAMTEGFREDRVNILMAHLFTDGALLGGGERDITIGVEYAIPPSRLPTSATYVALGHVHLPQQVKGAPSPTRYAGSLLQLDFGETEQTKSVFVVEAARGTPARVSAVPLTAGKRLVTLRGTLDDLAAEREKVGDAHLRVFVKTGGPTPGITERVHELLPNTVAVHLDYERATPVASAIPVSSLTPREQFLAYYRRTHEAEPTAGVLAAFEETLELELEQERPS